MAVMARESWTDGRLDEFKENVNQRFDEVDKRFDKVEADMKAGFDRVDKDIRELRGEISKIHITIGAMQRTMLQGVIAICGVMVTGFAALIGISVF
jgi:hypothetical protein